MLMDKGVDSGDILLQAKTEILKSDTADSLHDRLAELGAGVLLKTLDGFKKKCIKTLIMK